MSANGYRISFGGEENILKLDCGDGCTTLNTLKKTLNCILYVGEYYGISVKLFFFF